MMAKRKEKPVTDIASGNRSQISHSASLGDISHLIDEARQQTARAVKLIFFLCWIPDDVRVVGIVVDWLGYNIQGIETTIGYRDVRTSMKSLFACLCDNLTELPNLGLFAIEMSIYR